MDIFDPWAEPAIVKHEYGMETIKQLSTTTPRYDALILAVAHNEFMKMNIRDLLNEKSVVFDVKGVLKDELIDARL